MEYIEYKKRVGMEAVKCQKGKQSTLKLHSIMFC